LAGDYVSQGSRLSGRQASLWRELYAQSSVSDKAGGVAETAHATSEAGVVVDKN
jgi:hypothetical protein